MVQNCKSYWFYQVHRIVREPFEQREPFKRQKPVSSQKTARHLGISRTSIRRTASLYKVQNEPFLTNEQRVKFANWIRKENTIKILFSDEKMFDIDGIYNS